MSVYNGLSGMEESLETSHALLSLACQVASRVRLLLPFMRKAINIVQLDWLSFVSLSLLASSYSSKP